MEKGFLHIKKLVRAMVLLTLVVALAPCTIKESVLHNIGHSYERPIHKAKIAQNGGPSCAAEVLTTAKTVCCSPVIVALAPSFTVPALPSLWTLPQAVAIKGYARKNPGNSPPIYILYQQLKFDMA